VREDGLATPLTVVAATVAAAAAVIVEALLLRGLLDIGPVLGTGGSRLGAALAMIAFAVLLLGLDRPLISGALRVGRHLELRLRAAFFAKIPRLPHRYFKSRLVSDMVERGHAVHRIRRLPTIVQRLVRHGAQLAFTTAGIIWLDPGAAPVAVVVALVGAGLPLAVHPLLAERDFKVRSHQGALARFYLDALLGLSAVRSHAAERSVRREHEGLLLEWRRASYDLLRASVATQGVQILVGFALGAWLLVDHLERSGLGGGVLLLVYWALQLPQLGQSIAQDARLLPAMRSTILRLIEPLNAPEDELPNDEESAAPVAADDPVAITFDAVAVRAGGHAILRDLDLDIAAGEHVAVVGPSGAGKSTLVGLLLGWHRPAAGRLSVDGAAFDTAALDRLRAETAWVDPAVHVWNRSLHANLIYGTEHVPDERPPLDRILDDAELDSVLERLPDGLRTPLGEGGALVSGGEGQRVRLGRAFHRRSPRLAVLDEPFRGLDREARRRLLDRTRRRWRDATLLCVTHDVADTTDFPRVLVIEDGRLVEDGVPSELLGRSSRYAELVQAERATRALWSTDTWRQLRVADGRVDERVDDSVPGSADEASP
ncbi:MAG: ABC transporter ATP-binding protein, partial [Acidobacteriota bacterium]